MENQDRLLDFERDYMFSKEPEDAEMKAANYFIECIDTVSEDILSDEYIIRNRTLIDTIIAGFHDRNQRTGTLEPEEVGKLLEIFFGSIQIVGLR